nr:MAG TPA: hypothetical protein [Caudoviricetes sp.]
MCGLGSHKRDITTSNQVAYTNGPFSYLIAVGRDYEPNKLCLHPYHHFRSKISGVK